MKTIQDEILLVIPYIKSSQGNELSLALTGWRKYCKSPLRIIVIGEYDEAIKGKAEFIEFERAPKLQGQYNPNIDVARKLDMIYDKFHTEYDHFILANDDEYPVREFDWKFLTQITYLQSSFIGNIAAPTNYWSHDMGKTRVELDKAKCPHVNYCNHHPFYFDMERFHEMSMKYDLANNSLIRENLYYNLYYDGPKKDVNTIRYGFWDTKSTKENFRKNISNKNIVFMCNSVAGWSEELMELIKKYYEKNPSNIEKKIDDYNLLKGSEKIIVSFTSWKKRIDNCIHSIDIMRQQTLKPDKIVLNLSIDEFPQKENELPQDLVNAQDNVFEIYWVKENNKVYKKIIPTLNRYPNDIILSIDDDIEYPSNYIETLFNTYISNGKNHPIAAFRNKKELDGICHSGPFSLVKAEFFGPYLKDLYDNVVMKYGIDKIYASDDVYFYAALLNGISYKLVDIDTINKMKLLYADSSKTNKVNYSTYNRDWHLMYTNEIKLIREYIEKTYKKTYKELVETSKKEKPILTVLTMTSWKKRIQYVKKQIETIYKYQTILPDIFYLWLSLEEFPNKEKDLPNELVDICKKYNVKIEWLPYNDRNFKRWYVYPKHYNDLVISIDDDVNIDKNLIKEAKTHINEVNTIYNIYKNCTNQYSYPDAKKFVNKHDQKYSINYIWLGCSVVCPKSFPLEAITEENNIIRRRICRRCDESWLDPFRMVNNTKIGYFNFQCDRNHDTPIQKDATWRILSKKVGECSVRFYQLYVCLTSFPNNMKKFKELYPKYDTKYFDKFGFEYIINNILNE